MRSPHAPGEAPAHRSAALRHRTRGTELAVTHHDPTQHSQGNAEGANPLSLLSALSPLLQVMEDDQIVVNRVCV